MKSWNNQMTRFGPGSGHETGIIGQCLLKLLVAGDVRWRAEGRIAETGTTSAANHDQIHRVAGAHLVVQGAVDGGVSRYSELVIEQLIEVLIVRSGVVFLSRGFVLDIDGAGTHDQQGGGAVFLHGPQGVPDDGVVESLKGDPADVVGARLARPAEGRIGQDHIHGMRREGVRGGGVLHGDLILADLVAQHFGPVRVQLHREGLLRIGDQQECPVSGGRFEDLLGGVHSGQHGHRIGEGNGRAVLL